MASFASSCTRGTSSIWTLEVESAGGLEKLLTIEVRPAGRLICQARGKCNRLATEKELHILHRWATQNNLRLAVRYPPPRHAPASPEKSQFLRAASRQTLAVFGNSSSHANTSACRTEASCALSIRQSEWPASVRLTDLSKFVLRRNAILCHSSISLALAANRHLEQVVFLAEYLLASSS